MIRLGIDIETYSSVNLAKAGVHAYVNAPDFTILLFAYSVDGAPAICVDLANGQQIPPEILTALGSVDVMKTAHNAPFEITCLQAYLNVILPPEQWQCTQVLCAYVGLPHSLEEAGKVLNLLIQKDKAGKALLRYFTQPCKPTKKNGFRTRNLPTVDPEKWQQFKAYNVTDVNSEQAILDKISRVVTLPARERQLWALDQIINSRGILIDWQLVDQAMTCDQLTKERLITECKAITGLNPTQVEALKDWLNDKLEEDADEEFENIWGVTSVDKIKKLTKETLPQLIETASNDVVKRVLEIRQEIARTSIRKYKAMTVGQVDGYLYDLVQFYGAGTGRWAGRRVQVQNLRKNSLKDLHLARELIRSGKFDLADLFYGDTSDVISQLIRTAFIPRPGCVFIISDFAQIETRITAWIADETWRMVLFNKKDSDIDIYKESAATMFKKSVINITKDDRQRGKVSELALGFGGGTGALERMGALKMGIKQSELKGIVYTWRGANVNIVNAWAILQNCAIKAVETGQRVPGPKGLVFYTAKNVFFIQLPSGRVLSYLRPKIVEDDYGRKQICFEGVGENNQWGKQYLYGGKIMENVVQAIARDVLAEKMMQLEKSGFTIVMHVHDEVIIETLIEDIVNDKEVTDRIMNEQISWCRGLPIAAVSFESYYYKKDD